MQKKQATVQGLERISLILDFCAELEAAFKAAYDVRSPKQTHVPDSTSEHVKVAWFAVQERWFCDKGRMEVPTYPSNKKELPLVKQKLRKDCQNAQLRGVEPFKKHFKEMKCRCKNSGLKFRKLPVLNGTVHSCCTDPTQATARFVIVASQHTHNYAPKEKSKYCLYPKEHSTVEKGRWKTKGVGILFRVESL